MTLLLITGILSVIAIIAFVWILHVWHKAKQRDRWMTKEWTFLGMIISTIVSTLLLLSCISMWFKEAKLGIALYSEEQTSIQQSLPQEKASWSELLRDNFWGVYYHFVDPGNQDRASHPGGRFFAGIVAMLGIFSLNGLLVSGLISAIDRRKERWMKGEVRYKRLKNHIVIIGGHTMVPDICKELFETAGTSFSEILIQTKGSVEELRAALLSTLNPDHEKRVIIYYGDRTRSNDIGELCLNQAQKIYLIGENSSLDGKDHDTYNMTALNLLIECLPSSPAEPVPVYIMFEYQTTFSVFQFSDLSKESYKKIDFRPFNYYEMWAQKIFAHADPTRLIKPIKQPQGGSRYPDYLPLDTIDAKMGTYIGANSPEYVHLVVIGMSQMGVTMALEAAQIAHYPNARTPQGPRTRITFIDPEADRESGYLMRRYHDLFQLARWRYVDASLYDRSLYADYTPSDPTWHDPLLDADSTSPYKQVQLSATDRSKGEDGREFFIDIEWEFIKGGMNDRAVYDYLATCADSDQHPNKRLTVAVCLEESHQAIAAGLYLPEAVYERANQVLVYQRQADAIITNLTTNGGNARYQKVKPFGMFSLSCDLLFDNDDLAKLINYVYCNSANWTLSKTTPETVEESWREMQREFENGKSGAARRWSNIYHANAVRTKLRSAGWEWSHPLKLSQETIEYLAIAEHNRWNLEQLLMHYRPLSQDEQDKVKMHFDNYQNASKEKSDQKRINPKPGELKYLTYKEVVFKQYFKAYKNTLKCRMHHPDLCSYQRVAEIDDTQHYDGDLARALPYMIHHIYTHCSGQIPEQSVQPEATKNE